MSDSTHVPYLRRRNSPDQLRALNQLFDTTPNPTRAQRQALANDIGMELKSVTNWFHNRRQTSRKKTNENRSRPEHHRRTLDRSKISLDRIAALSERPLQLNLTRVPCTNTVQETKPSSPSELWTHMLSSPVVPPSDPDPEEARLTALSACEKTRYPLEWACLVARQKKRVDDGVDGDPSRQDVEAAITLLDFKTRSSL